MQLSVMSKESNSGFVGDTFGILGEAICYVAQVI